MLDSIRISGTDVGGNQILIDKPSGFGIVNQAGPMIFRTGGDSPNFNRMTIDINGNVGIGIPNPDSKLEIAGQIKITGGSPGNNKVLTSDEYGLGLWKTPPSSPWKNIGTSIRYDGGVGIGVDAWDLTGLTVYNIPSFGMGVGGEFTAGDFGVRGNAYAGSSSYIACGVTGYASGNEDSYVVGVYASTWGEGKRLAIYADGDIVCTGELIGPPSDLMLKQNIQPFSAINRIMKLEPKSFMFISGSQYAHINLSPGKHYGLVAQELEKVFPELVVDAIHPSVEEMRGEKGGEEIHYKGVKYIELIPILIQAVQEQQKTIEELTKRIEQLERR